ncbi:MAG: T9SS type A sorting domain-containing protein [Cytophagales bacterium]|nr:T9SS type A sorting domain-containing protein [Cytophagales bacterium]
MHRYPVLTAFALLWLALHGHSQSTEAINSLSGQVYAKGIAVRNTGIMLFMEQAGRWEAVGYQRPGFQGFSFAALSTGRYLLAAFPDPVLYNDFLPTYFAQRPRPQQAYTFELNQTRVRQVALHLVPSRVHLLAGSGSLSGRVELAEPFPVLQQVSQAPAIGKELPIILMDQLGNPLAWTLSDTLGHYQFDHLPYGRLKPEVLLAGWETQGNDEVSLSPESPDAQRDFALRRETMALQAPNEKGSRLVVAWPNPATGPLELSSETQHWALLNAQGQLVQHGTGGHHPDISPLPSGLYHLQAVFSSGLVLVQRVVKP